MYYWIALLVANLVLLLPDATLLRVIGALLLMAFLPGLSWVNWWLGSYPLLLRWTVAAALSYTFTSLITLLIHYLPGPIQTWQLLVALDFIAIIPFFVNIGFLRFSTILESNTLWGTRAKLCPTFTAQVRSMTKLKEPYFLLLTAFCLITLFLRLGNLDYSEFQGDEALAMITAAEALTGHEDALFMRSKGPGEVLLPMSLWQLTGTINEGTARLPFALAAIFAIITIYLIGEKIYSRSLNLELPLIATGFFAFNGFMVAFGRIVQYQMLVVWLSSLAFLLICYWRETGQQRFTVLAGLCLGTGLLAHYDAILVLPAIMWLFDFRFWIFDFRLKIQNPKSKIQNLKSLAWFIVSTLFVTLPFYHPYFFDPQANRTSDYVGGRIGNKLRNNLADFFHFNSFYSSFYYIAFTSLLVFGLLAWLTVNSKTHPFKKTEFLMRPLIAIFALLGICVAIFAPELTQIGALNLAILPFAVLLLGAFFAMPFASIEQALIIWLAVPFLGYNFVVALGLTHIYTIVPAWSILAGLALSDFGFLILDFRLKIQNPKSKIQNLKSLLLTSYFLLLTCYLWNAFIRHDVEYWQDFPRGNLSFYWTPYSKPPTAGFFGFAHRAGWKAIGQKIVSGELVGDYGSNEEPEVTTWYTRGAPRACDQKPEFYFLVEDVVDYFELSHDVIDQYYQLVGRVVLSNGKVTRVMQQVPITFSREKVDDDLTLSRQFDQTATPLAFARSARGSIAVEANFYSSNTLTQSNLIQLVGYDLNTQRAYPGGRVPVTLYWRALSGDETNMASYQVFVHLESETNGLAAQADGIPVCWSYPTHLWRPGQIIADQHAISLPPDMRPGQYSLQVGLYLPDTMQRLDLLDVAGNPSGTSITLTTVEIVK